LKNDAEIPIRKLRDRPFNLQGWGYGFLFRSEELKYFFLSSFQH